MKYLSLVIHAFIIQASDQWSSDYELRDDVENFLEEHPRWIARKHLTRDFVKGMMDIIKIRKNANSQDRHKQATSIGRTDEVGASSVQTTASPGAKTTSDTGPSQSSRHSFETSFGIFNPVSTYFANIFLSVRISIAPPPRQPPTSQSRRARTVRCTYHRRSSVRPPDHATCTWE
jgi:hypothetical protein